MKKLTPEQVRIVTAIHAQLTDAECEDAIYALIAMMVMVISDYAPTPEEAMATASDAANIIVSSVHNRVTPAGWQPREGLCVQ